jgi:pSer/pThr/pTyr-binding forkhead associated (FHA) protein
MAVFTVLQGRKELGSYRFDGGSVRIGRQKDCEIRLTDGAVSRNHAEVNRKGDSWVLQIKGARNGIFVNGNLVSFRVLKPGDRIEIATFVIRFDDEAAEAQGFPGGVDLPEGADTTINISLSDAMAIHNLNKDVMGAHVAWHAETEEQFVVALGEERTVIGSLVGCEVKLPEGPGSTGLCAAVVRSATGFDLEPLEDSGGLKLNARPVVRATRLSGGDRIELGNYIVVFHAAMD